VKKPNSQKALHLSAVYKTAITDLMMDDYCDYRKLSDDEM